MSKVTDKKLLGHIFAIFTIIVWGTTFIASKLLLSVLTPAQLMALRFLLAYIFLRIIKPRHPKLVFKDELLFLLLGITGCSAYFMCENAALLYTQTTNVSIIVATAPILTSLLTHFFTKGERINSNIIYGFFVAFIGIVLVVFNGTVVLKLNPKGDILSLGAALSWAVYSVLQHTDVKKYDSIVFSSKVMFYGFITSLPVLIYKKELAVDYKALMNSESIFCILFLGLVGSGLCYVLWRFSSKTLGIVATSNYIYFIPFVTMLASFLILKNEKITFMGVVGAVLVVLGVVISQTKKSVFKRKRA